MVLILFHLCVTAISFWDEIRLDQCRLSFSLCVASCCVRTVMTASTADLPQLLGRFEPFRFSEGQFTKFSFLAANLKRRRQYALFSTAQKLVKWQPHQMDDRRDNGRTKTSKAASIFFGRQTSERSCDVEVTDIANGGAGIYKQGLSILPLTFELSIDNLRRTCRMVWRRGNFLGVTFDDQGSSALAAPEGGKADLALEEPAFSVFGDPPQLANSDNAEALSEFASKITEGNLDRGSNFGFTIGIAVAFALPVLVSLGAYVAATLVMRTG